jgi:RNA polymerase sigma factor (TIGR02999 family)
MTKPSTNEITQLLRAWRNGDQSALERLVPLVEDTLRKLARHHLRGERQGHTLQTSDLIQGVYVRLIEWKNVSWQNRAHFFGMASKLMRNILVDYYRRNPRVILVSLSKADEMPPVQGIDLIALDEALEKLSVDYPRQARVVEMRFFGGMEEKEIAEALGIGLRVVQRDWYLARAWLYRELKPEGSDRAEPKKEDGVRTSTKNRGDVSRRAESRRK